MGTVMIWIKSCRDVVLPKDVERRSVTAKPRLELKTKSREKSKASQGVDECAYDRAARAFYSEHAV